MNNITHAELVTALVKPGQDIIASLDPAKANLLHMTVGVVGEAGELIDAIKKHVVYNKPLDVVNVVEELGDLEFYMEGLRQQLGITREETIQGNIAKLSERYKGLKYSDKAAQERADKAEDASTVRGLPRLLKYRYLDGTVLELEEGSQFHDFFRAYWDRLVFNTAREMDRVDGDLLQMHVEPPRREIPELVS